MIQAYLYRSQSDVEQLVADGIRVRLCKGAYKEPPEVAFPRKSRVDENFLKLCQMLLESPIYHAMATHDESIVSRDKALCRGARILSASGSSFKCCMECGEICSENSWQRGTKCGSMCLLDSEWYPYFMRRLAERPANVLFLARKFFRS